MAPLRWWLRLSVVQLGTPGVALAALVLCGALRGAAAELPNVEPGGSVTVGAGESWLSLRARFCPVESVQAMNPKIGEKLKIGDVVRSPFVLEAAVARANQERSQAEQRAELALRQKQESDTRLAAFEARGLEAQLEEAHSNTSKWRTLAITVHGVAALLTLLFILAAGYAYAMRRSGIAATTRLVDTDRRYAELRQSLLRLDTEVQRRALKLLAGHGARVITEAEFAEATRPLVENVVQLRQKHTG